MNLGNKILELRKQKNATQEELAADLGVTAAAVSKWENGYTLPDIYMLCALADFFAVTTDELLGRAKEVKYAVIAAENEALGRKVAEIAKGYGIVSRGIYTDYEEAKNAAKEDDSVRYLICCYFKGFYGAEPGIASLVSVASTEKEIIDGIRLAFENYLPD